MPLLVQLLGLALLIAGAAVLWGPGWALVVAGGCVLALGVSIEVGRDLSKGEADGARQAPNP